MFTKRPIIIGIIIQQRVATIFAGSRSSVDEDIAVSRIRVDIKRDVEYKITTVPSTIRTRFF